MALPATIVGGGASASMLLEVSGNLYCVAGGFVYKSTDGGSVWNEMDAANHPNQSTGGIAGDVVSGTIYVSYKTYTGTYLAVKPFNTATDTWGAALESTITYTRTTYRKDLAVRASGSYVMAYGLTEKVMGTDYDRPYIVRYASGAWQTPQVLCSTGVQTSYASIGLSPADASGRVHCFYLNGTTLYWKTLKADNTLSVETSLANGLASAYDFGQSFFDGTTFIAGVRDNTSYGSVLKGTTGDTLTLTRTPVVDSAAETASPPGIAKSGPTLYVIYARNSDYDIYGDSDAGTNTWGTDVALAPNITGDSYNSVFAAPVSGGIGYIYKDYIVSTVLRYNLWSLATSQIKNFLGVPRASIKKLNGIPIASIKKVRGVPNV